jgi:NAD(P)-dependent dehydrogenase (short-subunit alcohol dehydrogenase family)
MPVALITGGSAGLGLALATELSARGWELVIDARDAGRLTAAAENLSTTIAIAGDVTDPEHRARLAGATAGGLDLLVNNASTIGPSPMPALAHYDLDDLRDVFEVNVVAPLALIQLTLPALARNGGLIVNVTSDAAVEPYEDWGGYGSTKAALDQLSAILAAEQKDQKVGVYSFDPGDMRTELHQRAFPGQDISDRPEPASVVPHLIRLIDERPASGRYRA